MSLYPRQPRGGGGGFWQTLMVMAVFSSMSRPPATMSTPRWLPCCLNSFSISWRRLERGTGGVWGQGGGHAVDRCSAGAEFTRGMDASISQAGTWKDKDPAASHGLPNPYAACMLQSTVGTVLGTWHGMAWQLSQMMAFRRVSTFDGQAS